MAKDYEKLFDEVMEDISTKGMSLRAAIDDKMSSAKFFEIIKDENKQKQYARACEERADLIADEVFDIADNKDAIENTKLLIKDDNVKVQRDRLRIDSRKWLLSKLNPKKYGDKIDVGISGNITLRFDKDDEKA
jgi:hypothetical protein